MNRIYRNDILFILLILSKQSSRRGKPSRNCPMSFLMFAFVYVICGICYLATVPRWAYRRPEIILGEWKANDPFLAAAELAVMLSVIWPVVLLGIAWEQSRKLLDRFPELICNFIEWLTRLCVPEMRQN